MTSLDKTSLDKIEQAPAGATTRGSRLTLELTETLKLAVPIALTQLGQIAMMTTDLALVGRLGDGAVAAAAVGWADTLPAFLPLRLVGGAASAFVLVFGSVLVLDRPTRAGLDRWAALHFTGVGLGIALSALLVAGVSDPTVSGSPRESPAAASYRDRKATS